MTSKKRKTIDNNTESNDVTANLTASKAVVTDASNNLASKVYTSAATGSTIVSRDGDGTSVFAQVQAPSFFSPSTALQILSDVGGHDIQLLPNFAVIGGKVQILSDSATAFQIASSDTSTSVANFQIPTGTNTFTTPTSGSADVLVARATTDNLSHKTFTDAITSTAATGQLVINPGSSGKRFTHNISSPAGSRNITWPDPGTDSSIVWADGDKTINGNNTYSGTATFSSGVLLPTTGGTPATLNYYEEGTHSTTLTGIWAAPIGPTTVTVRRVGKVVTLQFTQLSSAANTASSITFTTLLPAKWRPTTDVNDKLYIIDNTTQKFGLINITASGAVTIYTTPALANFAGSGTSGILPCVVTYQI